MSDITQRRNGYILYFMVSTIFIWACFSSYFAFAIKDYKYKLIQEHLARSVLDIACICGTIDFLVDKNKDWDTRDYRSVLHDIVSTIDATGSIRESFYEMKTALTEAVEIIDTTGGTHASLYDEEWNLLSHRTPLFDGTLIKIKDYPEVMKMCEAELNGYATIEVTGIRVPKHPMYLYWRWVPSDAKYTNKLLVLIGVSEYSVNTNIAIFLKQGAIGVVLISTVNALGTLLFFLNKNKKRRKTDIPQKGVIRER